MAQKYASTTSLKLDSSAPTNNLDYPDPKYTPSLINLGKKSHQSHTSRWGNVTCDGSPAHGTESALVELWTGTLHRGQSHLIPCSPSSSPEFSQLPLGGYIL